MAAKHIQRVFDEAEFFSRTIRKRDGSSTTGQWWYGQTRDRIVGRVPNASIEAWVRKGLLTIEHACDTEGIDCLEVYANKTT